jgi:AraC-like DNA-binding protein
MISTPRALVAPKLMPSIELPVLAVVLDLPALSHMAMHQHAHGRLIHSIEGAIEVMSEGTGWILPPHRALWLPGGTRHEMFTRSSARMRSLDIAPTWASKLPRLPIVINVGPMLHALVQRAVQLGVTYRGDRHALALLRAIPEEVLRSPRERVELPFPKDRRIARICRALLDGENLKEPLPYWASHVGASPRTVERLFLAETAMTFVGWRQAALMQIAMTKLVDGQSIRQVCDALGIQSTSAFHRAFRKNFGESPRQYLSSLLVQD